VLDAKYWVKGCSSVGHLRYAVLLDVDGGAVDGDDMCLMDVKKGVKAAAPRYEDATMPRDNAQRVVEGARSLSPFLGERMGAARLLSRAVVIRELLPQDMKLEIDTLGKNDAMQVARYLAAVVGNAHARQMDKATRISWLGELRRNRSKTIDAPLWRGKACSSSSAVTRRDIWSIAVATRREDDAAARSSGFSIGASGSASDGLPGSGRGRSSDLSSGSLAGSRQGRSSGRFAWHAPCVWKRWRKRLASMPAAIRIRAWP
jgi:Uncharacterized protein conserved in bacteria (DUF2252)